MLKTVVTHWLFWLVVFVLTYSNVSPFINDGIRHFLGNDTEYTIPLNVDAALAGLMWSLLFRMSNTFWCVVVFVCGFYMEVFLVRRRYGGR